jgi:hypothetical protein
MSDSVIVTNPLNGIVSKGPRPRWMCKHASAEVLDRRNMIYACKECNSSNGLIKVIPSVTTAKTSPKKVSISPGKEGSEGFKV